MILEFLKGELNSKRFNGSLDNIINDLGLDSSIIFNGNIKNKKENLDRLNIMKKFRGYPDNGLFENFPKISEWKYLELDEKDIDNIYYIDYDYWNELSNGTSKPVEAAKVINSGREIEAIRRKPIRRELEGMVHFAGLVLLMALMVYVMIHDVQRIL